MFVFVPCTGRALDPSTGQTGPGLYKILQAWPGLSLHIASPGRAWAEKNIIHIELGPGLGLIKILIQNPDFLF